MKNPTNLLIAAGLVVVAGTWAKDGKLNARTGVATLFAAIGITMLNGPAPQIAYGLALIALVGASLTYGPVLFGNITKVVG